MTKTDFAPLLASPAPDDLSLLSFPLMASPKLDGIRCVKIGGRALTRSLKPIPNDYIRAWIEAHLPDGIDGELVLADNWQATSNEVCSAVMGNKLQEPRFCFAAFDLLQFTDSGPVKEESFAMRYEHLRRALAPHDNDGTSRNASVALVPHITVNTPEELIALVAQHKRDGFEGTMIRRPSGPYKFGRSTVREGILLKVKDFADEEAVVIGTVEEMQNTNEATVDALGHTERSTKKEGMVGKGRLGALWCLFEDGAEFTVGSGFTEQQRVELWAAAPQLVGRVAKIKHQAPPGGRKKGEAPRFPVFLGFRDPRDMSQG